MCQLLLFACLDERCRLFARQRHKPTLQPKPAMVAGGKLTYFVIHVIPRTMIPCTNYGHNFWLVLVFCECQLHATGVLLPLKVLLWQNHTIKIIMWSYLLFLIQRGGRSTLRSGLGWQQQTKLAKLIKLKDKWPCSQLLQLSMSIKLWYFDGTDCIAVILNIKKCLVVWYQILRTAIKHSTNAWLSNTTCYTTWCSEMGLTFFFKQITYLYR